MPWQKLLSSAQGATVDVDVVEVDVVDVVVEDDVVVVVDDVVVVGFVSPQ